MALDPDDDYDLFWEKKRAAKALKNQQKNETRVQTTHMWAGLGVFIAILIALFAFAALTLFRDQPMVIGGLSIGLIAVMAISGWRFVASSTAGPMLIGSIFR